MAGSAGTGSRQLDGGRELETLRLFWGDCYEIGWDGAYDWHARRRDDLGDPITAMDAEALQSAMDADFALKPVGPAPAAGAR